MTTNTTITAADRFASAKFNVAVADAAWDAVKGQTSCTARTEIADIALAARDNFYSTRAPDLGSVADKIATWFGGALFNDDFEMECHRTVIGDLRRFEMQASGCDEAEITGRASEQVEHDAAEWREALANYREEELLYLQGPSLNWKGRDAADILAIMEYLQGVLLELPALNLAGVIFKLELLWEQHSPKTVSGGAFLVELKRDLNSLIPSVEAEMARTD